ncbi:MAG TPA: cytochrome c oxidase subunit II [Acidimicrobiales bacterium]|nr:cytochrome c oxidase subunit II [Acidimicrobiales bacterium]
MTNRLVAAATDRLGASVTNWGSPQGITTQDSNVHEMWAITYYIAIPLGAIVIGLIVWCIFRYRERPGEDHIPRQVQYHIPLEALYTIVPVALVIVLFVFTYKTEDRVDNVSPNPALIVRVDAYQWGWKFSYPNGYTVLGSVANEPSIDSPNLPVLTLPAGETVRLDLYSDDVNHSFYVPAFLFKRDAIQGINNTFDVNIQPSDVGKRFIGECTQFCGLYHPYMRFWLDVMSKDKFGGWLSSHHGLTTNADTTATTQPQHGGRTK